METERKAKVNGADYKTQFLSPESGQLKRVRSLDGGVRMDFLVWSLNVCGDGIDVSVTVKVITWSRAWKMWEFQWTF